MLEMAMFYIHHKVNKWVPSVGQRLDHLDLRECMDLMADFGTDHLGHGDPTESVAECGSEQEEEALQHFLFLERPEGVDLKDAIIFEALGAPMSSLTTGTTTAADDEDEIVPEAQDFATVGHLYRGIEQGFKYLVDKYGEKRVFVGPPRAQARQQYFGWPELILVTDLQSAVTATETIVEEGEGARGNWQQLTTVNSFEYQKSIVK